MNQNIALNINLNASIATDQYTLHSECLKVHHDHVVLICVEKLQTDGFVVKMHDLKLIQSEEIFLVRKSSGVLAKIAPTDSTSLLFKEDFRSLVFDLAFA